MLHFTCKFLLEQLEDLLHCATLGGLVRFAFAGFARFARFARLARLARFARFAGFLARFGFLGPGLCVHAGRVGGEELGAEVGVGHTEHRDLGDDRVFVDRCTGVAGRC